MIDEQIEENAHVIIQQLIHHSECLGPALAGEALGLKEVYKDAFQSMEEDNDSEPVDLRSFGPRKSEVFGSTTSLFRRQMTYHYPTSNPNDILSFYTKLVRLLAYCASEVNGNGDCDEDDKSQEKNLSRSGMSGTNLSGATMNRHKKSIITRTRNILQNLVKVEDLVGILSTQFKTDKQILISSSHKDAILLFLDRVYGIPSPEVLLQLISQAFLPDIKYALQLLKVN